MKIDRRWFFVVLSIVYMNVLATQSDADVQEALIEKVRQAANDENVKAFEQPVAVSADNSEPAELVDWKEGRSANELVIWHTLEPGRAIADWQHATAIAIRKLQKYPDWPVVAYYRLVWSDGVSHDVPIRFGESIRELHRVQTVGPMLWAEKHVKLTNPDSADSHEVVYRMAIPNPRADQPIVSVQAVSAHRPDHDPGTIQVMAVGTVDSQTENSKLIVVAPDPIGSDDAAGSFDSPMSSIQQALDLVSPGDTILLREGYYAPNRPLTKKFIGEIDQWLTISAMPGESPVIDGFAVRDDVREKPHGEGINALGSYQHDTGLLHLWGTPHYTRIQGLHIQRSKRAGISVYGSPAPGEKPGRAWGDTQRVDIRFNTVYQAYSMGIISHRTNDLTIIGNRLARTHSLEMAFDPFYDVEMSKGELPQESIDLTRNQGFEVAFNSVIGSSKEAIDAISVRTGRIHHNMIDSCLNGIYIDSWSTPIRDIEIDRNFLRNAFHGIPLATEGSSDLTDIRIHHNIVVDSKSTGIAITEATYKANPAGVSNHEVWNNTVHRPGGHASAIEWKSAGISLAGFEDNPEFRDIVVRDNIVTETSGRLIDNVYAPHAGAHNIKVTHHLFGPTDQDHTPIALRERAEDYRNQSAMLGEHVIVGMPGYRDEKRGDFRPDANGPARGAASDGGDLGALTHDAAWRPGLDFAGNVTYFYEADMAWSPLHLPRDRFNLHRNNLQRPSWFQWGRYGPDFRHLPHGDQSFAGVHFYVEDDKQSIKPTVIALAGLPLEGGPERVEALPVNRIADRLAFLHTGHFVDPRGGRVLTDKPLFKYVVNYSDGSTQDIPVQRGKQIDHWKSDDLQPISEGRLAWALRSATKQGRQFYVQLYLLEWDNPFPEKHIDSIDIARLADSKLGTTGVFAISTGRSIPDASTSDR
jgi:hypothetical protein